jgi:hypothetical protein
VQQFIQRVSHWAWADVEGTAESRSFTGKNQILNWAMAIIIKARLTLHASAHQALGNRGGGDPMGIVTPPGEGDPPCQMSDYKGARK